MVDKTAIQVEVQKTTVKPDGKPGSSGEQKMNVSYPERSRGQVKPSKL